MFLCHSDELTEGSFREFILDDEGRSVYLVATRRNGNARAWFNICPHQGRALNWAPNRFLTDDRGNLVCAAHGAVFEPDQGRCISGPCLNAFLRPIEILEDGGRVLYEFPDGRSGKESENQVDRGEHDN